MSANPWFGALPLRERRAMLGAAELLRLRPGEMLFRQGDRVPPGKGAFYGLVRAASRFPACARTARKPSWRCWRRATGSARFR